MQGLGFQGWVFGGVVFPCVFGVGLSVQGIGGLRLEALGAGLKGNWWGGGGGGLVHRLIVPKPTLQSPKAADRPKS